MSEEINTDHFSTMEELLEHLKMWERDDDIDSYYRFFSPSCAFELAHKIEKQQKEIEKMREELQMYVDIQNNDIHNYISKDKIRAKIEEITSYDYTSVEERECQIYARQVLKNLLEEN